MPPLTLTYARNFAAYSVTASLAQLLWQAYNMQRKSVRVRGDIPYS
jgi:hypothetical protein